MNNNLKWIECNLPWVRYSDSTMPVPNLSLKEIEVFGTTLIQEEKNLDEIEKKFNNNLFDIRMELEDLLRGTCDDNLLDDLVDSRLIELSQTNELVKYSLAFEKFKEKRNVWFYEQPEIVEWISQCDEEEKKIKQLSFSGLGLNKPGVLIEIDSGEQYLIGHINRICGVCDDCIAFESDVIIKRYAVLIELD